MDFIRVAINGFGRIGRLVLRVAMEHSQKFEIVAINDLVPADHLAYLLRYDTTHRSPRFSIHSERQTLVCQDKRIHAFAERDPAQIPYADLAVDYVIEASGAFTTREDAAKHLHGSVKRVLISAPAKGDVATFVFGVNHQQYDPRRDRVLSNASCTTNCLAPLTKILIDHFGIEEGLMTTIHAMTASQPTVDAPSKKDWRGGRAASVNIVPAATGAAQAVGLCLPAIKGKLTGMAFRVPTIDVSAIDLVVRLTKPTTYTDICEAVKSAAAGEMKGIVQYCDEDVVSSDFIGSPFSCIFDQGAGIELNPNFHKLIAWYDNEMGYACRIVDMVNYMASRETEVADGPCTAVG